VDVSKVAMTKDDIKMIFENVQAKDKKAFNKLVQLESDYLNALIFKLVQNKTEAQDILQDCFVRIWEKSYQFKGNASPRTWMSRIALNLTYRYLKRKSSRLTIWIDEMKHLRVESESEHHAEDEYRKRWLTKGLKKLTSRQRDVFMLRVYQDLAFADIGFELGCSENAAKVHFHEAQKKIKQFFKEYVL
jgi:RNA polymerase sigma-70 factor, ECF subfamily